MHLEATPPWRDRETDGSTREKSVLVRLFLTNVDSGSKAMNGGAIPVALGLIPKDKWPDACSTDGQEHVPRCLKEQYGSQLLAENIEKKKEKKNTQSRKPQA